MATAQQRKTDAEQQTESDVPGAYFGTDGAGFDHYWMSGDRYMRVTDGDDVRKFKIPDGESLVDWAIHSVVEHDAYWEQIKLDPPKCYWLTGELEVGERKERNK